MTTRQQAERLVAEEFRVGGMAGEQARAAFRVCERLRRPLTTYAGAAGFRSLLGRALGLARVEQPWLNGVKIAADGSIEFSTEAVTEMATNEATDSGVEVVLQLLVLLITFIGETLTFRIVQEVWPKAAIMEPKPEAHQS